MVSGTDTTLDGHCLQGLSLLVLLGAGDIDCARLVADDGSEDDVFT